MVDTASTRRSPTLVHVNEWTFIQNTDKVVVVVGQQRVCTVEVYWLYSYLNQLPRATQKVSYGRVSLPLLLAHRSHVGLQTLGVGPLVEGGTQAS
ncbi:hypothetical protein E2C01_034522 [Portunus trituberculatus]|uniref:Uncharacterized protein n=1 Tax=Portunus trituberculatus TaxID=210409 RepID=A0A5B7F5V6_PORTR|nr:hypothetical protein [Portunus trituberculatus]